MSCDTQRRRWSHQSVRGRTLTLCAHLPSLSRLSPSESLHWSLWRRARAQWLSAWTQLGRTVSQLLVDECPLRHIIPPSKRPQGEDAVVDRRRGWNCREE
jgi:hypothetical protein